MFRVWNDETSRVWNDIGYHVRPLPLLVLQANHSRTPVLEAITCVASEIQNIARGRVKLLLWSSFVERLGLASGNDWFHPVSHLQLGHALSKLETSRSKHGSFYLQLPFSRTRVLGKIYLEGTLTQFQILLFFYPCQRFVLRWCDVIAL